ncbi:MAG TPA: hypothetical protein VD757_00110, partial [Candidatus Nitrosocosmicus sp.]|nr:hypothetical protein [Candidatus Nitrosocosmicus sp.]
MINKRLLVLCVILTVLAATLQALPRLLGDAFAFAAVLGGFPIYAAAHLHWAWGIAVYLAAAYLSSIVNMGEAMFFICSNGIIGLSLGISANRLKNTYIRPVPSVLAVIAMLSAVNSLFGINIFGYSPLRTPLQQVLILFLPLYIYCLIFLKLAIFADDLLHRHIELDT